MKRVASKISSSFSQFRAKLFFHSGAKSNYEVGQLRQHFTSKYGKRYFKVGPR